MIRDEDLKGLVTDLSINKDPDAGSISERLWDEHPEFRYMTDSQQDEVIDHVFELWDSSHVAVYWIGD